MVNLLNFIFSLMLQIKLLLIVNISSVIVCYKQN